MEHPASGPDLIWLLGTAAVMTIAAVNAFGWLLALLMRMDRQQTDDRHEQATRFTVALNDVEERLERRVARVEEHSIGFQRQRPSNDD